MSPGDAKRPARNPDPWPAALAEAAPRLGGGDGSALLFYERRQDLLVEHVVPGDAPPAVTASRSSGLAVRSAGFERELCVSEALPDDAAELARLAGESAVAPPRLGRTRGDDPAGGEGPHPAAALHAVQQAARLLEDARPGCLARIRWVGFDQRVVVARPGRQVVTDHRHGRRLRLEAEEPGTGARAVAETCFDAGRGLADQRLGELALRVAARLEETRLAVPVRPGDWPVVFAAGAGGVLLHEIVGHALEADTVLDGRSWLGAVTAEVAPRGVRIVDDPRRGRAAWRFDDEGEAARPTPLVRDGRVAGRLYDVRTSWLDRRPVTGHGRRAAHGEPVRPRMGCTFLAAGPRTVAEVLGEVERGLYVRRLEAGSVDTRTGRAVFRVTDADLIVAGRIDRALLPFLIEVNGPDALRAIDAIASDLEFDTCVGSCVRDGQPLSTSVGAPTFCAGMITAFG